MTPRHVLLVEDDEDLVALTRLHLVEAGFDVSVATDGDEGAARIDADGYDLVLLDLGLPGANGLDLARRVRARSAATPLVIVTARGAEVDRVLGLELGADDYLVKPVGFRELVARVRTQFRRIDALTTRGPAAAPLVHGPLTLDRARRSARVHDEELDLTAKEFELLALIVASPGRAFTRSELLEEIWGRAFSGYEHTVNSHMNRLRKKLGAARDVIETVWGVGYRLADPAPTAGTRAPR